MFWSLKATSGSFIGTNNPIILSPNGFLLLWYGFLALLLRWRSNERDDDNEEKTCKSQGKNGSECFIQVSASSLFLLVHVGRPVMQYNIGWYFCKERVGWGWICRYIYVADWIVIPERRFLAPNWQNQSLHRHLHSGGSWRNSICGYYFCCTLFAVGRQLGWMAG